MLTIALTYVLRRSATIRHDIEATLKAKRADKRMVMREFSVADAEGTEESSSIFRYSASNIKIAKRIQGMTTWADEEENRPNIYG